MTSYQCMKFFQNTQLECWMSEWNDKFLQKTFKLNLAKRWYRRLFHEFCQKMIKSNLAKRRWSWKWPPMIGLDFGSFTCNFILLIIKFRHAYHIYMFLFYHYNSTCALETRWNKLHHLQPSIAYHLFIWDN